MNNKKLNRTTPDQRQLSIPEAIEVLKGGRAYPANELPAKMPEMAVFAIYHGSECLHIGQTGNSRGHIARICSENGRHLPRKLAERLKNGPNPVTDDIVREEISKVRVRFVGRTSKTALNRLGLKAREKLKSPYRSPR